MHNKFPNFFLLYFRQLDKSVLNLNCPFHLLSFMMLPPTIFSFGSYQTRVVMTLLWKLRNTFCKYFLGATHLFKLFIFFYGVRFFMLLPLTFSVNIEQRNTKLIKKMKCNKKSQPLPVLSLVASIGILGVFFVGLLFSLGIVVIMYSRIVINLSSTYGKTHLTHSKVDIDLAVSQTDTHYVTFL